MHVFENGISPIREAFTFVAWVKWEGGGIWQRVFDFGHDSERSMFFTPSAGDTLRPRFAVTMSGIKGEQHVDCPAPMPTERWVMLTVTFADDGAVVYLDGAMIARNDSILIKPGDILGTHNFLGASQYRDDPTFNGLIGDVAVFDRVLTDAEIHHLYQQTEPSTRNTSER